MYMRKAIWMMVFAATAAATSAQTPAGTVSAPPTATPAAGPATAADLLQPALSNAQSTLTSLKLDKWKKGSVREEAESNVNALLADLNNNIQPLITTADSAPGQLSKAIPLVKHLDAFYDVLLRVEEASRVAAPAEQIGALQDALLRVSQARIAYDDVLQSQAAGVEKQIADLQTAMRAEQADVKDFQHQAELAKAAAKTAPCKAATPAHKKRRRAPAKKTPPANASSQPAQQPQ